MRKPDDNIRLSDSFLRVYRRHIFLRIFGSLAVFAAAIVIYVTVDFRSRYAGSELYFLLIAAFALSSLLFRLDLILFKPSWVGTITDIRLKKEMRLKLHATYLMRERLIVHLIIDRGTAKPYDFELWHEGEHGAYHTTEEGREMSLPPNKYHAEAPYKIDDTLVYLRGLRYPIRYGVEVGGIFDPLFVCPFCGDINKAERDTCYHCGRPMIH